MAAQPASAGDDADKAFYDLLHMREDAHRTGVLLIRHYFDVGRGRLQTLLGGRSGLRGVDLGAGSCALSLLLTQLQSDLRVVAFDISQTRMRAHVDFTHRLIPGDLSRIEFREGSFNDRLPFADESLDLVVFDAALHHARSMWHTLAECRRVLRPDGVLYAQREHFLSPIPALARRQIDVLLASDELASAVSENIYTRQQYDYYMEASGFSRPELLYVSEPGRKRWFSPLNGVAFVNGILIGRPRRR